MAMQTNAKKDAAFAKKRKKQGQIHCQTKT
jgi:hypothetical protein